MTSEVPEMVMRVAKALSGAPFPSRRSIIHARTVLEALRDPPDSMCVPGGLAIEEAMFAQNKLVFDGARDCWNEMLSAALASPTKE